MDQHDFNREMQALCKIEQDNAYMPIRIAPPLLSFKAATPRTEAELLYEQITGFSPRAFDQAVKGAYQTKSDLETADKLGKAIDRFVGAEADPRILAKSVAGPGTIPFPFEAACLLCNQNFMSKQELDRHDRESESLHKILLRR